jgi:uncharacterized LabA/DUF88 family protein
MRVCAQNDSLWDQARLNGFEVDVFDRSFSGKEKEVDTSIVTTMLEDSYQHMQRARGDKAILLAGDRDYVPAVESLGTRGIETRAAASCRSRAVACRQKTSAEFVPLDPHLELLAR